MPQITELGKALTSVDLKGRTFIFAGFTDAKGSANLQSGSVGAARGCCEAVPIGEIRDRGEQSHDGRVRPVARAKIQPILLPARTVECRSPTPPKSSGDALRECSSPPVRPLPCVTGASFLTPSAVG